MRHMSRNTAISKHHMVRDCFNPVITSTVCTLSAKIMALEKPTFIVAIRRGRTKVPKIGKPMPIPY